MTIEHVIFIPGVLFVGFMVGFVVGSRAVRNEMARARERAKK